MNFSDFIGNEKIKQQLSFLAEANRLPHAIVLEGEEGIGKRTLARELVLNLFCIGEGEKPCRNCAQCKKVLKGIHPDVYEYTAPGGVRSFHVDVVRDVKEDVYMQPNEAAYKVYILGNCQCMSESAQNAILKILEEPPEYALFILTVTTKAALLETVLSRSVVMTLEGVDAPAAAQYLCRQNEELDEEQALQAVRVCNGNIGKALQCLNDGKLSQISRCTGELAKALLAENEYELIKACAVFERDKDTLIATMTLLKTVLRDAMLYSGKGEMLSGQEEAVRLLASRLSKEKLLRLMAVCDTIRAMAERNGNNAILITKVCYELRRAIGR